MVFSSHAKCAELVPNLSLGVNTSTCAQRTAVVDNLYVHHATPLATLQARRMIVELYAATTKKFNAALQREVRKALIPIVFINCDLWQSKVSGEKFIGE